MSSEVQEEFCDRFCLKASSWLAEPFCFASYLGYRLVAPLDPTKFDNCTSKTKELALRSFIVAGIGSTIALLALFPWQVTIGTLAIGLASRILRAAGFACQKKGFTYVRGEAPEVRLDGQAKVLTWNILGAAGGLHYDHGGVIPWRNRIDKIVAKITEENVDVVVLQEIYDTALAERLIQELKNHYTHIFTHIGPNVHGSVGGGMVFSKCAFNRFTSESFTNNSWQLNRTFTTLDILANPGDAAPCARIIGTHLIHNSQSARESQVAQIVRSIDRLPPLPTLLVGDLNLERDTPQTRALLEPHFEHGYIGEQPTCTNRLIEQWDGKPRAEEWIDYASLYRNQMGRLENTDTIKTLTNNTQTALSDHDGVRTTLVF